MADCFNLEVAAIKHLPNLISLSRILLSVILLLTEPLSVLFFAVYVACGASDILDGYIARKAKAASPLGATIDSIADAVFMGSFLIIFSSILSLSSWMLSWIGIIAVLRMISLFIGFIKYRAFAFLHTYANKATGIVLFAFPFLYRITGVVCTICIVCMMASVSSLEELMINCKSKTLSREAKSIFALAPPSDEVQ